MKLLRALIDLILPPHEDQRLAGAVTMEALVDRREPREERGAYAIFPYRDPQIRAMIRSIKYYGETAVLRPLGVVAAEELAAILEEKDLEKRKTFMVPVPSSPKRLRKRGYNQAERIARAIYDALPQKDTVTWAPQILAREDRETQVHALRNRADNIKGAFYLKDPEAVRGARVIVVDDVVKTGATLRDIKRALKSAGAAEVILFAIAY